MSDRRNLKKALLYLLVGSVILGAVLGIILVLRNKWGWFEVRVILTTVTVALASLCGLACDVSRTPRGKNLLPRCGLGLTFVSAGLILIGMWSDMDSEGYWKSTAILPRGGWSDVACPTKPGAGGNEPGRQTQAT